jgi:hypothetical protein
MLLYSFLILANLVMGNYSLIQIIIGFFVLVLLQIYLKVQNCMTYQLIVRCFSILVNFFVDMPNFVVYIIPEIKFNFGTVCYGMYPPMD